MVQFTTTLFALFYLSTVSANDSLLIARDYYYLQALGELKSYCGTEKFDSYLCLQRAKSDCKNAQKKDHSEACLVKARVEEWEKRAEIIEVSSPDKLNEVGGGLQYSNEKITRDCVLLSWPGNEQWVCPKKIINVEHPIPPVKEPEYIAFHPAGFCSNRKLPKKYLKPSQDQLPPGCRNLATLWRSVSSCPELEYAGPEECEKYFVEY